MAATPSPTPTEAVAPTVTSVPGVYIDIQVVHDLNKDGLRQPEEPGVPDARLHGGCSDALSQAPATDGDGRTRLLVSAYQGRIQECITLEHRFGWLETTDPVLRLDFPAGEARTALFLIHDLGPDVMEVSGEPIVAGVPDPGATITLGAPFGGCIERAAERRYPLLFIVGAARPGCPPAGTRVQLLLDGSPAGVISYEAGRASQDLVARGDSMRIYGSYISAARIGNVDCAVIQPQAGGLIPPGLVRVFVLSEEVRAGCGAPGRLVRFYRNGMPLDPLVDWRAGPFLYPDVPDFTPARAIVSPNTGGGATPNRMDTPMLAVAAVLMALGSGIAVAGLSNRMTR